MVNLASGKTFLQLKIHEEILLEIAFTEEMRTTWANRKVHQTFFHDSFYLRKYDLIRLSPSHWRLCI